MHRRPDPDRGARRLSLHKIPGLYERLEAWLPGLIEHRCNYDVRGGFLQRLKEGTWTGHILEHVVLELMTLAGLPDGFGRTRETTTRGVYKLVVSNFHEECTRLALELGRELLLAAIKDEPFDIAEAIKPLRRKVNRKYLGPSTAAIVNAAEARKIPHIRLLDDGNLVQLGYGASHAPHLDGRNRQHQRHRRDHLARQGPDQGTDFLGRRAGTGRAGSRRVPTMPSKPRKISASRWSSSRPTAITAGGFLST